MAGSDGGRRNQEQEEIAALDRTAYPVVVTLACGQIFAVEEYVVSAAASSAAFTLSARSRISVAYDRNIFTDSLRLRWARV
jgi:hypothetical protein